MRPTKDQLFSDMARLVATRSTCFRRAVGCVLVNGRGHVLSTGYNGVAAGQPHCSEGSNDDGVVGRLVYKNLCGGAKAKSGQGLDLCEAIHAEQNALLQCRDVYQIDTVYVTTSPCMTCVKLLLNTSCHRIVYIEEYTQGDSPMRLWTATGRVWEQAPVDFLEYVGGR
jgi:dCMP deaminase